MIACQHEHTNITELERPSTYRTYSDTEWLAKECEKSKKESLGVEFMKSDVEVRSRQSLI